MSRIKFSVPTVKSENPEDPKPKKSYQYVHFETEKVKPETVQRVKNLLKQRPEILEEKRFEYSGHIFEVKKSNKGFLWDKFETEIKMIR